LPKNGKAVSAHHTESKVDSNSQSSGLEVYATCSPRNFDLVKSLGATHVYDYNSSTCGADIRRDSDNAIYLAYDCISEDSSIPIVSEALSSDSTTRKPIHHVLRQFLPIVREDVQRTYSLTFTLTGEPFGYKSGSRFEGSQEDFEWAKKFSKTIGKLLEDKTLEPVKPVVGEGGLEGVLKGIDLYRQGKVSGQKISYRVA
jgi:NADPH:quinone reductase-like Zn-dependent oxidoreductase